MSYGTLTPVKYKGSRPSCLSSWRKADQSRSSIDDQPRGNNKQSDQSRLSIDDQSRGNNKQSGYVYVHERAEKIVEGIVDEFCLFFSSIKAVSLQLGRGVAK